MHQGYEHFMLVQLSFGSHWLAPAHVQTDVVLLQDWFSGQGLMMLHEH